MEIVVEKKHFWVLVSILSVFIVIMGSLMVYAGGRASTTNIGHTGEEVEGLAELLDETQGQWPEGTYCVVRKVAECPSDVFATGSIKIDLEDTNPSNYADGNYPYASIGDDVTLHFCCK